MGLLDDFLRWTLLECGKELVKMHDLTLLEEEGIVGKEEEEGEQGLIIILIWITNLYFPFH